MKETIFNLKFAWKYIKDQKSRLISFVIASLLNVIISIIVPILSAKIIINLTSNELNQALYTSLVILAVGLIRNLTSYFERLFTQVVYREAFKKIQIHLGSEILKIENKCLDSNSSGVFIQRLTNDTSKIADVFNALYLNLTNIITDIGIFAAVFIINKKAFLYLIVMITTIYFIENKRVVVRNENDNSFSLYVNGILKVNDVNGNVEISAVNGIGISGSLIPITHGQTTATVNITIDNASSSNYPITLKFYFKKASESDSSYRLAGTRTLNNSNSISYTYSSFSEYASYILRVVATDVSGTDASIEFTAGISCFLKGTKVISENGPINIENVKVGDYIYALNLDNNERELRRVNSVYEGYTEETYEITVGDELIITTPKHQFYVVDKGWIRAFDLQEGDVLNSISDGNMVIDKIEHKFHDVPLPVYNMSIEELHNYLVTEYQLLVHNDNSPWPK